MNGLPENKINEGSSIIYKDDIPSGFIMPKSGMLQVYYAYLVHYDGPMPFYSTLNAYFYKDDSTRVDSLWRRFPDFTYWQRNFQFCYPPTRYEWDYFPSNNSDEYLWDIDKVNEGDSIQVTYFSDWVASQDTFTYPVYSATEIWVDSVLVGWDVILGNYDWCMGEFDNALYISIGVRDLFNVSLDPEEISPGDTADIIIKKVLKDGTLADFDTSQTFELGKLEGCEAGYLLAEGDTSAHFYNVHQPFKFIAADSIEGDSASVKLRVGLIDNPENDLPLLNNNRISKLKNKKLITADIKKLPESVLNNKIDHLQIKRTPRDSIEINNKLISLWKKQRTIENDDISFSCFPENWWVEKLNMDASVIVKEYSILLGETKYYQAKYEGPLLDKLIIEEVQGPSLNGGLTIDVWHENPITITEGDKLGVYWEKEKPVYGTNPPAILPEGLIRIVGRYWSEEQTYRVKLTAKNGPDEKSILITVNKPNQLGNSEQAIRLNNGIDVESHDYSIDSVCIKWGGQFGLPPQYIKGQYVGESFYDNNLERVTPSYRYEAWNWEYDVENDPDLTNGHFWVTWQSMGNGDPVPNHENTRYMSYETTPHSVWYFIDRYSNIEHSPTPGGWRVLGNRDLTNNRLIFNLYSRPRREYNQIRNRLYKSLGLNDIEENPQVNESARLEFIDYMKNVYEGGLANRVAQSRIASSYGPIQPLYVTVLDYGYSVAEDYPPENLNDLNIFWPFALNHFLNLLEQRVAQNLNNWTDGLEATLTTVYQGWNPKKLGYGANVIMNGQEFTPIETEGE
ncbi:MAG TPA: hypothetical protein VLB50_02805 [Ignavibacteriaceae bacterium]|nr:hypothetical protein [Ignavibacteriaceae bacterium]